jgi:hypothetical protein
MSNWLIAGMLVLGIGSVVSILMFGLIVKDLRAPKVRKSPDSSLRGL